jgi:D-glycerate 3-kinase
MAASPHPLAPGFAPALVESLLDRGLGLPGPSPVLGISGLQGSGKSTLAAQLVAAGRQRGLHVVALSLDDFYLGRRERLALARQQHPLWLRRGPPGTHDLALMLATIEQLKRGTVGAAVAIPRFDKLADTRRPPSRWRSEAARPDLIVLEGWCLGLRPQAVAELRRPVNALEREQDVGGHWRRSSNEALARYAELWRRIDYLLWLKAPGFDVVPQWRWLQEKQLQAQHPTRAGMDRRAVGEFVRVFERLSRHAQATLGTSADEVIELDRGHRPRASG